MKDKLLRITNYFNQLEKDNIKNTYVFDNNREVDDFLLDFEINPLPFFVFSILDRNDNLGIYESLPIRLQKILNKDFTFENLRNIPLEELEKIFVDNNLTKYPEQDANYIYSFIYTICDSFEGKVENIYNDSPSSDLLLKRLMMLPNLDKERANLMALIMTTVFNLSLEDKSKINVSNDNNIKIAMYYLDLVSYNCSYDEIKNKCIELNPEFPGVFDRFFWMIGEYIFKNNYESFVSNLNLHNLILSLKK